MTTVRLRMSDAIRRGRGLGAAAVALAAMLAACTVGPDFQSPKAPAAPGYAAAGEGGVSTPGGSSEAGQHAAFGTKVKTTWWTAFRSPELDRAVTLALAGNRDLATAEANLAEAREAANAAAGGELPQVSAGAGAVRQKLNAEAFGLKTVIPPFNLFSVGPSVSYALDIFGGTRRLIEQQEAFAQFQGYQLAAAHLTVAGNVATQAFEIASARGQIKAVEDILADDEENLKLVRSAFSGGAVTQVDVLTAESQLANDRTLLPPLRQRLAAARHALSILAGKAPAEWSPPDFDLAQFTLPADLPVMLPSELVHDRPDILAAESQLHAATANVGIATANLYPRITLTASLGQQSTTFNHLFDAANNVWSLGSGLTAPIFNGGTLQAEKRGAEDAARAALARYEQVVLKSFAQVADVLQALSHDAEQLNAQRHAQEIAGAALRLTRLSFNAGNIGILQVLDAERQFQRASLGLVRTRAQLYFDTAQLYLAMGGNAAHAEDQAAAAR